MKANTTELSVNFNLPFYLRMSGKYKVKLNEEEFIVYLTECKKEKTTMPGLSEAKNVSLVFDDTPHFRYTKVQIDMQLPTPNEENLDNFTQKLIPDICLKIINRVIETYRDISEEYIIPELTSMGEICMLDFKVHNSETFPKKWKGGMVLLFDRKIGIMSKDLDKSKLNKIQSVLTSNEEISLSRKLYLDARLYQKKQNIRMALINLTLSFEVFLVDIIDNNISTVIRSGYTNEQISKWTMGDLATKGIKAITGNSLEKEEFWSKDIVDGHKQIQKIRNTIMHKGSLKIKLEDNSILDLNDPAVLEEQFKIVDKIKNKLNSVINPIP